MQLLLLILTLFCHLSIIHGLGSFHIFIQKNNHAVILWCLLVEAGSLVL